MAAANQTSRQARQIQLLSIYASCLESGKAKPSREMVLLLASALDLPLRERNALLHSAGFAAAYPTSGLDSSVMEPVNRAITLLLQQQEPYGALVLDSCWNIMRTNSGAQRLFSRFLDQGRVPSRVMANIVRATLHPEGLRAHLVNWPQVAALILDRLEREQQVMSPDGERATLLREVRAYPGVERIAPGEPTGAPVAIFHLQSGTLELRIFSLLTTIGTPLDVSAQELTIESFFPADEATERWFRSGEEV